jgi:Protein of unknown function (DUF3800)
MLFVSDESGGFNLSASAWDPSLWSTLVCPPSCAPKLRDQTLAWCEQWGVEELHGSELKSEQRREVATFLGAQEIIWLATVIDSGMMSASEAEQWRADQVAIFDQSWAESEERGTMHSRYVGMKDKVRRLLANPRKVRPTPFVQFGIVAPSHIYESAKAAIRHYEDPRWSDDWTDQALIFDQKDIKPEGGQRLLREVLTPVLAGKVITLGMGYQDKGHPLRQATSNGGLNVLEFCGGEPRFVDSRQEPLVQLADLIGWTMRRVITNPSDQETMTDYRLLKLRCYRSSPSPIRLFTRRDPKTLDLSRYTHLA